MTLAPRICRGCQAEYQPTRKTKNVVYCSRPCAIHDRRRKPKACAWCRAEFTPWRTRQRCCSKECGGHVGQMKVPDRVRVANARLGGQIGGPRSAIKARAAAIQRAVEALGGKVTAAEIAAFRLGWKLAIKTRWQRAETRRQQQKRAA